MSNLLKSRRVRLVPLVLVLAGFLTACLPQLEIYPTLQGDGTYRAVSGGYEVTLHGEIRCNREVHEGIDVFIYGALDGNDGYLPPPCDDEWSDWSVTVNASQPPPATAYLTVQFCTNPGERIDEDCVDLERAVDFSEVP